MSIVSNSSKGSLVILAAFSSGKGQAEGMGSTVPRTAVGVGAGASAAKVDEMKRRAMHREMIVSFILTCFIYNVLYGFIFSSNCWKKEREGDDDVGRVR